jgi:hypothetical protein
MDYHTGRGTDRIREDFDFEVFANIELRDLQSDEVAMPQAQAGRKTFVASNARWTIET